MLGLMAAPIVLEKDVIIIGITPKYIEQIYPTNVNQFMKIQKILSHKIILSRIYLDSLLFIKLVLMYLEMEM